MNKERHGRDEKGIYEYIEGIRKGCLRLVYQMVEEDNHM